MRLTRISLAMVYIFVVHSCAHYAFAFSPISLRSDNVRVRTLLRQLKPTVDGGVYRLPNLEERQRVFKRIVSIAQVSRRMRRLVIGLLIDDLRDQQQSAEMRIDAAYLLSRLRAQESLNDLVVNLDLQGSYAAVSLLTKTPMVWIVVRMGQASVPHLARALNDDRVSIRQHAATALGFISGPKARKILEEAMTKERDPSVTAYIQGGLAEIEAHSRRTERRSPKHR